MPLKPPAEPGANCLLISNTFMRLFITGICGFVGSTVALALRNLRPDAKVTGIDNFCRPGSETNRRRLRDAGIHVEVLHDEAF